VPPGFVDTFGQRLERPIAFGVQLSALRFMRSHPAYSPPGAILSGTLGLA
jgi:hypothetical protein